MKELAYFYKINVLLYYSKILKQDNKLIYNFKQKLMIIKINYNKNYNKNKIYTSNTILQIKKFLLTNVLLIIISKNLYLKSSNKCHLLDFFQDNIFLDYNKIYRLFKKYRQQYSRIT